MSEPERAARFAGWKRLTALAWPGHPLRWRDVPGRLRPTLSVVVRLTAASVVAYLFTLVLTEGAIDLTGALTALLVVQASAYSTLKMSIVRVGAVLSGVLVATGLSTWIGLTWWSLGAAIAASLFVGKVLRLGDQALETPISAMLILGVTNHDVAAEIRVVTTLIGAGVGVAFNLIFPPPLPTRRAGRALTRAVEATAAPLDAAGDALAAGPVTREQVDGWLDQARAGLRRVADAADSIAALRDSRRFNARALGTVDVDPVLATGLNTVEQCLLAVRSLFVVLRTEIPTEERAEDSADDPYGAELRSAVAVVLHDVGDCLRAFGSLVLAEAEERTADTEQALADSLEILRETQAILTELITVDARENTSSWLLRAPILAAIEHVLLQLNLEDRARIHRQWEEEQSRRPMAQLPSIIVGVLPHPDKPYLRGFGPEQALRPFRGFHERPDPPPSPPTGSAVGNDGPGSDQPARDADGK